MTVNIETARDTPDERAAAARLADLIDTPALARYLYTDRVLIDGATTVSHSHPVLTLGPRHVLGVADDVALSVFVHEQMHWAANVLPNVAAAVRESEQRWPHPPGPSAGGAYDARSTWLHLVVCALEIAAMTDLVGEERALAAIRAIPWYRWIYEQLTSDSLPWRDYLGRWGLELPAEPSESPDGGVHDAWIFAVEESVLRPVVGPLTEPFADVGLPPEVVVRVVAACCLRFDEHRDAAATIDPLNADVYEVLDTRRAETADAARRLRDLRGRTGE